MRPVGQAYMRRFRAGAPRRSRLEMAYGSVKVLDGQGGLEDIIRMAKEEKAADLVDEI